MHEKVWLLLKHWGASMIMMQQQQNTHLEYYIEEKKSTQKPCSGKRKLKKFTRDSVFQTMKV